MLKTFPVNSTKFLFLACVAIFATLSLASGLDWYNKRGEYKGWKYIVIHHSATAAGSAKAFDNYHTKQGYGGLAYHFVIGNGAGTGDGVVETGARWQQQITGTHVSVNSWQYNIFGIGICLVGNFEETLPTAKQWTALVDLAAKLAKEYNIPAERIIGHQQVTFDEAPQKHEQTSCPGKHFPLEKLRQAVTAKNKKKI